jgi:hypothetical protein
MHVSVLVRVLLLAAIPTALVAAARAADSAEPKMLLQGGQLHERCLEKGARDLGVCQGYIGAVVDLEHLHSSLAGRDPLYCIPEGRELSELVDRVTSWMVSHPQQADRPAVAQVTFALIDTFPCPSHAPAAPDPSIRR